jgi:hypothetical protein
MKHLLPREITHSGLGETIQVWGSIEIDDDGIEATIHSKVDGHRNETDCFFGNTFKELETDMGSSNYPFDALMDKVRSLRYWPKLEKRIKKEKAEIEERKKLEEKKRIEEEKLTHDQRINFPQNHDGSISLHWKRFHRSTPAVKTFLIKDGEEIRTELGTGRIRNASFNKSRNSFSGILLTKEGDYKFEIDAESGKLISKHPANNR